MPATGSTSRCSCSTGSGCWAALTGDFGTSIQNGQDVRSAILEALPPTLQISLAGLAVAVVFGGTVALVATYTRAAAGCGSC